MTNDLSSPWKKIDRERERELKRAAVIQAGAAEFNSRGYRQTSLDDIAARLGVSKPTLYYSVKSKEDLLFEIFRTGLEQLGETAQEAETSEAAAEQKLARLVRNWVVLMTTDLGRTMIRVSDNELSPTVREEIRKLKRAAQSRLEAILEQGQSEGSSTIPDVKVAASAIAGAMNWVAIWYDPHGRIDAQDMAEAFWGLFSNGLLPR
jgi:AcrR family transcriptional regulator